MKSSTRITYKELFFISFFIIVTIGKSIGLGAENKLLQIGTISAFISLGISFFCSKYTVNEFILCLILVLIGIGTYIVTKREGVLLSILVIIGLKNIDSMKVFRTTFIVRLVTYISIITLALLGIIENKQIIHWRDGIGEVYRYALGYSHPNLLHSSLFIIVILFIYLYYEKMNIWKFFIIFISNLFIYNYSGSRTGFYLINFSIIFTIFIRYIKYNIKYKIIKSIFPLCIIFTFVTAILYGKVDFINSLDRALSGRIYYSSYFLKNYSFSLLGNNLYLDNNLIDNSYSILLANYGLIIFSVYIFAYHTIIKKFILLKKDKELIMICLFSIYGITEGFLPNIFMNLSLVFIGDIIFRTKINNKEIL